MQTNFIQNELETQYNQMIKSAKGFYFATLLPISIGIWSIMPNFPELENGRWLLPIMCGISIFSLFIAVTSHLGYRKAMENIADFPYFNIPEQYEKEKAQVVALINKEYASGNILYERNTCDRKHERILILPSFIVLVGAHIGVSVVYIKDILWGCMGAFGASRVEIYYDKGFLKIDVDERNCGIEILQLLRTNYHCNVGKYNERLNQLYSNNFDEFKMLLLNATEENDNNRIEERIMESPNTAEKQALKEVSEAKEPQELDGLEKNPREVSKTTKFIVFIALSSFFYFYQQAGFTVNFFVKIVVVAIGVCILLGISYILKKKRI